MGDRSNGSATVLILGNRRIAKIVNLRFPFSSRDDSVLVGASPKPRDFLGIARCSTMFC